MSRYAKDRTNAPRPKPVTSIELDEKRIGPRLLVAALLLAVSILFIAYGITQCNATSTGWTVIVPNKSIDTDAAGEFTLLYELGASSMDATAENKALTVVYTDALEHAAQLFSSLNAYEGVVNLCYVNAHPNEVCVVDDELYAALALLDEHGNRDIFLAPLMDMYQSICLSGDDAQAASYDPALNPEMREFFDEVLTFVRDPEAVDIELLGSNRVRFAVSEAYAAFCEREGITHLLDLGWMENAFVVDAVADALEAAGHTHGCLSSFDGFARNLDEREDVTYAIEVSDRVGNVIRTAATMAYPTSVRAIAVLKTYSLGGVYDALRWYETADGVRYHPYIDAADGCLRAAWPYLVAYTDAMGCAELACTLAPIYIADDVDEAALQALSSNRIWHVYVDAGVIRGNGDATFTDIADEYRVA